MRTYQLHNDAFGVFSDGVMHQTEQYLNDNDNRWANFYAEDMVAFFNTRFQVFMEHLKKLQDPAAMLTSQDEKELLQMLETLLSAKRILNKR